MHSALECGWGRSTTIERLTPGLVEDLGRAEAYPDDPTAVAGVEHLQTHLSHLFLTRARVVKLRKAVDLGFVDFSRRAERTADCEREVALNRRLAPDVYLGVAPLRRASGHFVVREREWWEPGASSPDQVSECVVVMRRLEDGGDALSRLAAGTLRGEDLDAAAALLARFHDDVGLGSPAPWEPEAWWQHVFGPFRDTLATLARAELESPGTDLEALSATARDRFEFLRPRLEARRREGRAVDGHGDVHLQHIWYEGGSPAPVLIDCLEFDADLRRIDAANDVAFLAMDLSYRDRRDLAARFLRKYAAARDDFGLFAVVDAYQSYRAAVRAKVAALAVLDEGIPATQRTAAQTSVHRHLELARDAIGARKSGSLVLVCGTVGVGKSTVAEQLAELTGGVVISSDRTRKRLAGIPPDERRGDAWEQGLYAPEKVEVVYAALLERAVAVVESGRLAVLDATFGRAAQREKARAWAEARGVEVLLLEVGCCDDIARERLRRRSEADTDPSDAGPERLEFSRSRFEPPHEWRPDDRHRVRTDRGVATDGLRELAARLIAPH